MAAYDLETARAKLALYDAAEAAVLSNQEYEIDGRRLKRADLAEIQRGRALWETKVNQLERKATGRNRTRYAVPG